MGRVTDKVVFITGAGQGQGRSHAVRFAEEGADVIAVDACAEIHPRVGYQHPSPDDLGETKELVEKAGRRCVTAVADVRYRDQVSAAVDAGLGVFGRIDAVLANAGIITFHERSWEIEDDVYDAIVDTNLKGVWNTIVCTVPSMIEARRGGTITITSSAAGIRGQLPYAHYVASKHGVVGLMKAFANELAPHRIRVNTVHPTGVASPGMGIGGSETAIPIFMANPTALLGATNLLPDLDTEPGGDHAPVGVIPALDVSHAMLWLACDEARYVTGVQLAVDAGNTNKP
ncbi:mycofactocin-coupled SDR family oxidoreductase [Frankia sp. CiP3]|uniref:mycofactocin-coupled SDR family oxidoreductase n=1 Tax=Frankia sp. CiP3 TaxID=2880971 RepID=UPI001EF6F45B|nr:mycofactocin-coupled SDR family oxidoreductase [Frankia sp. CiP3]